MAIYKLFNQDNDVITNVKDTVSSGMWENGSGTLTAFYTSSVQSGSSGEHYLDVYGSPATTTTRKVQFSVAYAHFNGSGSLGAKGVDGNRAAATIYRQLSNTLLGPNENQFTFAGSGDHITPKYVYALSVSREFLREKMDPGNWELRLGNAGGKTLRFIDDSGATTNPTVNQGGRVFNIVSGSIATGTAVTHKTATEQQGGAYGLFYPDLGILVFNGPVLNTSASLSTELGSNTNGDNSFKLFSKIASGSHFQSRREEVITSQHYFVRVPNQEFNFSANPTFATASDGSFSISSYYKNPKSFITQVGLYNDSNELLAVAKLSKPLLKSFSREALIKVKLDF
jgi:hypothetical protein|tara:strand:+ start:19273 stop:20295 length:1023 start_codon:yes stop_codon:yes gene_type:complete